MKKSFFRRFSASVLAAALLAAALLFPGQAEKRPLTAAYFPNWNVYSDAAQQVKNLPWDQLDCVYHAFWKIEPKNGEYPIVSTDPWADTDENNPKAHFPQYAAAARQHPGVSVILSIGGWTCSGQFSQMALTKESRDSFIQSCLDVLDRYPFLAGLDLDWEYPGEARADNPVLGDDKANYTALLRELRAALDQHFGKGKKQLTVCAAGAVSILKKQDYAALFPYVDRVNLMTYDMTGSYNARTGHHTALYGSVSVDTAVKYLMNQGVPAAKIAIGSPFYGHGWRMNQITDDPVGVGAQGKSGTPLWRDLKKLEGAAGWRAGYDESAQAAYLWNDDPASADYKIFYTYENERSLDAKIRYIRVHGLAGMIVWQTGGDDGAYSMLTRVHQGLGGAN